MTRKHKFEYTSKVPREGEDENIEPSDCYTGLDINGNVFLKNSKDINLDCVILKNDIAKTDQVASGTCEICGKKCKGERGLKIHKKKSHFRKTVLLNEIQNTIEFTPVSDNQENQGFCTDSRCETCPKIVRKNNFFSSVTGREYHCIGIDNIKKICKKQNYIYLLTCNGCGIQYVGESILPLHKRMNLHRTSKQGCDIFIHHFKEVCPGETF